MQILVPLYISHTKKLPNTKESITILDKSEITSQLVESDECISWTLDRLRVLLSFSSAVDLLKYKKRDDSDPIEEAIADLVVVLGSKYYVGVTVTKSPKIKLEDCEIDSLLDYLEDQFKYGWGEYFNREPFYEIRRQDDSKKLCLNTYHLHFDVVSKRDYIVR